MEIAKTKNGPYYEDTKNREELLKLEGGKEAFEKRGEKLNIR